MYFLSCYYRFVGGEAAAGIGILGGSGGVVAVGYAFVGELDSGDYVFAEVTCFEGYITVGPIRLHLLPPTIP